MTGYVKSVLFWNRTKTGGWPAMKAFPRQLIICTLNPLLLWVLFINAIILGGMVVLDATYVETLMAPPYNFNLGSIGISKLSYALGALLAYPVSGNLTKCVTQAFARRNRGIHEPEHYLPVLVFPVVSSTLSLVLFGIAVDRQWHWGWILFFVGLNFFGAVSIFVSILWATEAFPKWAAPSILIVGAGSYMLSFALGATSQSWISSQGVAGFYVQLGILNLGIGFIGLPVNFWGETFRRSIYARWGSE
jgi:hypothetical protein